MEFRGVFQHALVVAGIDKTKIRIVARKYILRDKNKLAERCQDEETI